MKLAGVEEDSEGLVVPLPRSMSPVSRTLIFRTIKLSE